MPTDPFQEGRQLEIDFFGWTPNHSDEERAAICKRCVPFEEACIDVIQSQVKQRWTYDRPATPMSMRLFEIVRENVTPKQKKKVLLFCALGTVLDYVYGVDGFFTFGNNISFCVSFDLTRSGVPIKRQKQKANVLITKADLENRASTQKIGELIAGILMHAKATCRKKPTPRIFY